jgi:PAS domain S-box-containing protein
MEPVAGDRANRQTVDFADLLTEAILSTRSDAIVATDRDGNIRFWNPGAERVFGHSRRDAVEHSLDLIIPERLRQRHWQGFTNVMRSGQSRYGEGDLLSVPALRNDGTTLSVQFTISLLRKAGEMVGMAAIIRDVTKQFQETRALKRALSSQQQPMPADALDRPATQK